MVLADPVAGRAVASALRHRWSYVWARFLPRQAGQLPRVSAVRPSEGPLSDRPATTSSLWLMPRRRSARQTRARLMGGCPASTNRMPNSTCERERVAPNESERCRNSAERITSWRRVIVAFSWSVVRHLGQRGPAGVVYPIGRGSPAASFVVQAVPVHSEGCTAWRGRPPCWSDGSESGDASEVGGSQDRLGCRVMR